MKFAVLTALSFICLIALTTAARSGGGGRSSSGSRSTSRSTSRSRSSGSSGKSSGSSGSTVRAPTRTQVTKAATLKVLSASASRNPKVKSSLTSIRQSRDKAQVLRAVAAALIAVRLRSTSRYERQAIALSVYRSSRDSHYATDADLVKEMGPLAMSLDITEYRKMNIEGIHELVKVARQQKEVTFSKGTQIVIFSRLVKLNPARDWTEAYAASLGPLKDGILDHKDLKSLPRSAILGLVSLYKESEVKCRSRPPNLFRVFLSGSNIRNEFASTLLPKMGSLLCYMSIKDLKSIPSGAITTVAQVRELCRVDWSSSQIRIVTPLAMQQSNFTNVTRLTCQGNRIFAKCWRGVKSSVFRSVPISLNDIDCFNSADMSTGQQSILAKKIRDAAGPFNMLGVGQVRKVIAAAAVSATQLLSLNTSVFKDVADEITKKIRENAIKDDIAVILASKRVVEERVKDRTLKLAKLPSKMISRLSLTLMNTIPVDQLGISTNASDNDTSPDDGGIDVSLASVAIKKLKSKHGAVESNVKLWRELIIPARRFCCGFSSDVSKLPDDLVRDFLSVCQKSGFRCPSLIHTVKARYGKLITEQGNQVLTENDLTVIGRFLPGIQPSLLVKMADDDEARQIAINYFKEACNKDIYPVWRARILTKIALAMLRVTDGGKITSDTINSLECLVQYIEFDMWKAASKDVIAESAESLGQYKFASAVRTELVKKIKEKYAKNGNTSAAFEELTAEQFGKVIGLLVGELKEADVAMFKLDVLKQNKYQLAKLEFAESIARAINQRLEFSSSGGSTTRKRRATEIQDLSKKTATEIIEMGSLLYGLSPDEIKSMESSVFKETLAFIGGLQMFSQTQLEAWVTVLERAYTSIQSLTDDDLKRIGNIVRGMTPSDIGALTLTNIEVIAKLSAIEKYSAAQIQAMFDELKKDLKHSTVEGFTGLELQASGKFLTAAVHTNINKIKTDHYKTAARSLGEIEGWDANQMAALKSLAVSAFGNVNTWDASVLSDVGAALGGCTVSELNSIAANIFNVVKGVAIKQLPVNLFKELTVDQLKAMTLAQYGAVTDAQKNSLISAKLKIYTEYSEIDKTVTTAELLKRDDCHEWLEDCNGGNKTT